ncbi:hypothetical protein MPNT_90060 [Candidatus Methylacidithermus pantelleriae]|uniref:Uncharacterized protein n=1 Tax=Candidatus Methylacidithermus pantelleriae TaxID=2744239 RepID=A0A8J2BNP9_9BACT|nr:hypothetical protein MPNT_90060 [Candidatus Methylacidithermus pantelleriae]
MVLQTSAEAILTLKEDKKGAREA